MDLILWRHADADPGGFDLARELTPKGREQAARMATWLRRHLPPRYALLASPAVRAQQTAQALGTPVTTEGALGPGATAQALLRAAAAHPVAVLVGHQPDLGRTIAWLLCGVERDWPLDKGAVCWMRERTLRALVSAELL